MKVVQLLHALDLKVAPFTALSLVSNVHLGLTGMALQIRSGCYTDCHLEMIHLLHLGSALKHEDLKIP